MKYLHRHGLSLQGADGYGWLQGRQPRHTISGGWVQVPQAGGPDLAASGPHHRVAGRLGRSCRPDVPKSFRNPAFPRARHGPNRRQPPPPPPRPVSESRQQEHEIERARHQKRERQRDLHPVAGEFQNQPHGEDDEKSRGKSPGLYFWPRGLRIQDSFTGRPRRLSRLATQKAPRRAPQVLPPAPGEARAEVFHVRLARTSASARALA